jgi:hypothetical protein
MAYGSISADTITSSTGQVFSPSSSVMKNRIINGAFTVSQYNGTSSYSQTGNTYGIDRWYYQVAGSSGVFSQQQLTSSPPPGFGTYLTITNTSAQSIGSGSRNAITQSIEGYNFYDLGFGTSNAKTVTLSFWVKSSISGTHGGCLENYNGDRSYPFSFSIPAANTWTYITITIPGDTTGSWGGANNGGAATLLFGLGCGSTYSGNAGAWASGDYRTATGATTAMATTSGATFSITGVQLEAGPVATQFEYRQIGQELALCQRYYELSYAPGVTPGTGLAQCWASSITTVNASSQGNGWAFKVTKRATPTTVFYNAVSGASGYSYRVSDAASVATTDSYTGPNGIGYINVPGNANGYYYHFTATAEL